MDICSWRAREPSHEHLKEMFDAAFRMASLYATNAEEVHQYVNLRWGQPPNYQNVSALQGQRYCFMMDCWDGSPSWFKYESKSGHMEWVSRSGLGYVSVCWAWAKADRRKDSPRWIRIWVNVGNHSVPAVIEWLVDTFGVFPELVIPDELRKYIDDGRYASGKEMLDEIRTTPLVSIHRRILADWCEDFLCLPVMADTIRFGADIVDNVLNCAE